MGALPSRQAPTLLYGSGVALASLFPRATLQKTLSGLSDDVVLGGNGNDTIGQTLNLDAPKTAVFGTRNGADSRDRKH